MSVVEGPDSAAGPGSAQTQPEAQAGVRVLLIGVPDSTQETLRNALLPQVGDLELIAASPDRLPQSSDRFHVALVAAPRLPRRRVPRPPDSPILVLRAKSVGDPALAAIHIDPRDEEQLVESVRAALDHAGLAGGLSVAAALRHSEERARLTRTTHEAAWDWDLRTGRVSRGGGYLQISGYSPDEIPPDLEWWKERIHPDDRAAVLATLDGVLVGDHRELIFLYRFRRRDGTYAQVLDRGFVLHDDSLRPERIIGFAREVGLPSPRSEEGNGETHPVRDAALARLSAIELLTDVSLTHMPLELLLTELLNRLRSAVGGDAAMAHLLTEDRSALYCHASVGIERNGPTSLRVGFGQGILGRVAETGKAVFTHDLRAESVMLRELREGFRSLVAVPIVLDQSLIGVLSVATHESRQFLHQDQRLLELVADRLAPTFDRAQLLENVRLEKERLEALSRRLVSLQEEERSRVSRELHDEIGQLLTALQISLQTTAPWGRQIEEIIQDLFVRIRDISMSLRPPMLDDLGLVSTLRWYCERFTSQTNVRVHLDIADAERRFPPEIELTVFRVAQEALTNVARHAHVHDVYVDMRVTTDWLEVHIVDYGVGFDAHSAHPVHSSGLTGMRERANLVHGRLSIQTGPGRGTRLTIRVPIDPLAVNGGAP